MTPKWMKMIFIVPLAILGMILFTFIGGEVVLRLWNWLAPELFGWRQLTFWQALGLLALCRILFGGFGFHGSRRHRGWGRRGGRCGGMSPEERERFRQAMHERFEFGSSAGKAEGSAK